MAALLGGIIVKTLLYTIGYSGFLVICIGTTSLAAFLTYKYGKEMKYDYIKGYGEDLQKDKERETKSSH